ncbi:MAG: glycoside hydrolase family 3 N-terminal domain-containing protein, partial [Candidatus Xenobia bacterium]
IYTDSLAMKAIADNYGYGDAAVRSVQAGADMVLALGPEEIQLEVLQALSKAVHEGRITQARFNDALRRVLALKRLRRTGEPHDGAASPAEDHDLIGRAAAASITVLRNPSGILPLPEDRVLVISPASLPQSPLGELAEFGLLGQLFAGAEVCSYPGDDTPFDTNALVQKAQGKRAVVLGLYARGALPKQQHELAEQLAQSGVPLVVALLGSPYVASHLDPRSALVAAYNFTRPSLRALVAVIKGELKPQGHIPVAIPGVCEAGTGLTW